MTDEQFTYDALVQDALRSVVSEVLKEVEKNGLRNEHHFYIAFRTQFDGVEIPQHLVEAYPEEMTIVLQHRFWGLKVFDDRFEIGLSFNKKPEHLKIPFEAVIAFVDPSAQFALQFEGSGEIDSEPENDSLLSDQAAGGPGLLEAASTDESMDSDDDAKVVALDSFRQK